MIEQLPANSSGGRQVRSTAAVVVYISLCAFAVYSCMFGFRKPYTTGTYGAMQFMGISYKVCLVIAQVLGYMCSKFYGIRFISSVQPGRRPFYILLFIGLAWLSLLLFAVTPPPYNIVFMFFNGLPLGMVYGLVLGFIEGRRTTELMGAVLVTSFIFAAGMAKTAGKWLQLSFGINDWWMPFAAGAVFVLPLLLAVWLLGKSPPPGADDIDHRSMRSPMSGAERRDFIRRFGWSLVPVVAAYVLFTIVRDFCEDFANELWIETGYRGSAGIFTRVNTIVSLVALAAVGAFFLVKNNFRAFLLSHWLVMAGVALAAVATACFQLQLVSVFVWMVLAVTGMYLAYIPFNCIFFERMLAAYKVRGNIGFVMYIADAFGYLGTVAVLLIKEFFPVQYSWVSFFSFLFYTAALLGIVLTGTSLLLHRRLYAGSRRAA